MKVAMREQQCGAQIASLESGPQRRDKSEKHEQLEQEQHGPFH
jgi:hypothetical protein